MASSAQYTFIAAVAAAEGVRQTAKTAAFNTWAFQPGAPLATYQAAILAADQAYNAAVKSAANTEGETLGPSLGHSGLIRGNIASLLAQVN
jgi:hypothetical protein